MKKLVNYNNFLILEKYDRNIRKKLIEMGVSDEEELNRQVHYAKHGFLGQYLQEKGEKFTFGILKAIFKDAINAKKVTRIKRGIYNIIPSIIPVALAPFFPVLAIIGTVFGFSRIFHKVFDPLFGYLNPSSKYSEFLKKMIDIYMMLPEGDVPLKDRFTRAFVVSDRLVEAIKPEVLDRFSTYLSDKMENTPEDLEVPDHFIENELKSWLNDNFDIDPEIPLKDQDNLVLHEESSSNYKSTKDWPDGKYNGIISGYEVYSDDIDSGFKAITGVRGMNIPCIIHVKNGEAIVKDKDNDGIITFSSEKAKQNYANSI